MSRKRSYDTAFKPVHNEEGGNFSNEIVTAIKSFTKENILHDFLVQVDGETFRCHKFILASCSLYVRDFCRSWVGGENEPMTLTSISARTFEVILQMISTSKSALTADNYLRIWRAAHFLQIKFLIKECERFASDCVTVATLEDIYRHARLYDAFGVLRRVRLFVQKHFEAVCKSDAFLALTFEDLHWIIKGDKLRVKNEDDLLRSIFRWVSHHGQPKTEYDTDETNEDSYPNAKRIRLCNSESDSRESFQQLGNRSAYLCRLLKASRYYLASVECLTELQSNSLVEKDLEVKNILFEASRYKQSENRHGYWPPSACHRKNSGMVHCGFCVVNRRVRVWDLKHDSWHLLPRCYARQKNRNAVAVYNNQLYLLAKGSCCTDETRLFVLTLGNPYSHWNYLLTLPGADNIMVPKGNNIYTFDRPTGKVHCITPKETFRYRYDELKAPKLINMRQAFCFEDSILIFCTAEKDSAEVTDVYRFNVASQQWTMSNTIPGPAKYIVNFRTDSCHYVIQRNGHLWKLAPDADTRPRFNFVKKLWSFTDRLKGAFIYNSNLYVVGNNSSYTGDHEGVDGVFKKIVYFSSRHCSSNFAHCVLPKKRLEKQPRVADSVKKR